MMYLSLASELVMKRSLPNSLLNLLLLGNTVRGDGMITQERLKELVSYQEETGNFIRVIGNNAIKEGTIAGGITSQGYIRIMLDGIRYSAHRLVFLYMHGYIPKQVDHIDGDRSNNRVSNLRSATNQTNQCNVGIKTNNTTGIKGVSWSYTRDAYLAEVMVLGTKSTRSYSVTATRTKEQALILATAWVRAKRIELHGEFANHG